MYSQSEIQSAIDAGVVKADTITALDKHVSELRSAPVQDEENFRLITGFNDIFVAIAAIIMLVAAVGIGGAIDDALEGVFIAITAWGLAEFFTLKRRMALPSIILLIAFVGGIFSSALSLYPVNDVTIFGDDDTQYMQETSFAIASAITALMSFLHWKRFKVPITIAAGAAAIAGVIIFSILSLIGLSKNEYIILSLVLMGGLCIFAFAMRWDISDKLRETRRSDVAFWLHLLAAPMIAHPLFYFIGATGGDEITALQAFGVFGTYIIMAIIAIIIDRRAMLVSALAYVLIAMTILFNQFGAIELNVALTAFVIGSALLSLSAFWTPLRKKLVSIMPNIVKDNVPAT